MAFKQEGVAEQVRVQLDGDSQEFRWVIFERGHDDEYTSGGAYEHELRVFAPQPVLDWLMTEMPALVQTEFGGGTAGGRT